VTVGLVLPAYEPDTETLRSYVDALLDVLQPAVVRVELDAPGGSSLAFPDYDAVEVNVVRERRGKGLAITQGFDALDTDVLAFADADGSTPAESIADVVSALDSADVAVGSRRHPASTIRTHQSVLRRKLGDAFAWGSRLLLPVSLSDYQCGAKALTREAWRDVRQYLYEPGFAWDVELVAVADARGLDIAEVPVEWEDDPRSTVDTRETVQELARTVFSLRRRYPSIAAGTERLSRTRLVER